MRAISENSAKKMIEVADDPEELIVNLKEIRVRKCWQNEETKLMKIKDCLIDQTT